jgi:hypothetical protein
VLFPLSRIYLSCLLKYQLGLPLSSISLLSLSLSNPSLLSLLLITSIQPRVMTPLITRADHFPLRAAGATKSQQTFAWRARFAFHSRDEGDEAGTLSYGVSWCVQHLGRMGGKRARTRTITLFPPQSVAYIGGCYTKKEICAATITSLECAVHYSR